MDLIRKLTAAEAAAHLRVSLQTLAKWRVSGDGPPYLKFGRRVLYDFNDLEAWAAGRRRRSTSCVAATEVLTRGASTTRSRAR